MGRGGCRAFQTVGIGGRVISINYGRRHLLWVGGRGCPNVMVELVFYFRFLNFARGSRDEYKYKRNYAKFNSCTLYLNRAT